MPQVYFSTETYSARNVDHDYVKFIDKLLLENRQFLRYLKNPYLLKDVPGFYEAMLDDFNGWHLHHIAGEFTDIQVLQKKNLYWHQEPWELEFVTIPTHRQIHSKITRITK